MDINSIFRLGKNTIKTDTKIEREDRKGEDMHDTFICNIFNSFVKGKRKWNTEKKKKKKRFSL